MVLVTSDGLDVIIRSNILSFLVGSVFICSRKKLFTMLIKKSHCAINLPPGFVPPVSQLISPRLKSPPRNIFAFLYFRSAFIFDSDLSSSCRAFSSESGGL